MEPPRFSLGCMPPGPQRDAEFDTLINGAIKRSIMSFSKLAGFAHDNSCLPAQYERMIAVMYYQLDANKIPRGERREDFDLQQFQIPFVCLTALGVTLPIWLCTEISTKLVKGLTDHWVDIRQWILFLYKEIISQHNVDIDLRLSCKTAVLEFLGLVRDRLLITWSRRITTDRGVMRVICELWFLETRDEQFFTWSSKGANQNQRESAVLNSCFLIAHEMDTTIDWENILGVFRGDTELIASAALRHLDREISQKPLDLRCVGWDMHIVSALSFRENIRLSLLRQGAIKAAADVLWLIVSQKWVGENNKVMAARCMVNAVIFLKVRMEDMDGTPFILQALDTDLIPSLLKCEPLLPFTDNETARQQPILVLGNLLTSYTIYRSVLRAMHPKIDAMGGTQMELNLIKGGQLHSAWLRLKEAVAERCWLMKRDIADGYHIQSCQSEKCARAGETGTLKRCGGCLHAFYCSKACQRYDWKYGKHKPYCRMVHQRYLRTNGQMATVQSKDIRFFDQIIISELRKHRARINTHRLKINVVELDFVGGNVDVIFDSRRVDPNPFGIKCSCERFAHARWVKIVERAKEAKDPVVLVRAYIPGGMSRKILLRVIPLGRVLGEENQDHLWVDETKLRLCLPNHLNLIYTCCGQESMKKDPEGFRG
ncbi:hypothetical protein HYDPIDRAFT_112003 [Hydnomerulius pinastri MD-312]|uniref:MYND-type domain-containing protein n=1 Tax=Hydnomerulius pinastri MD-312 TaxID=994086 RepID=A0A0C9WFA4_9AGAM|nr:hypothetical protein HYDPIDRAFT_112003 [Hydnomerulius pinastri MD-312]